MLQQYNYAHVQVSCCDICDVITRLLGHGNHTNMLEAHSVSFLRSRRALSLRSELLHSCMFLNIYRLSTKLWCTWFTRTSVAVSTGTRGTCASRSLKMVYTLARRNRLKRVTPAERKHCDVLSVECTLTEKGYVTRLAAMLVSNQSLVREQSSSREIFFWSNTNGLAPIEHQAKCTSWNLWFLR